MHRGRRGSFRGTRNLSKRFSVESQLSPSEIGGRSVTMHDGAPLSSSPIHKRSGSSSNVPPMSYKHHINSLDGRDVDMTPVGGMDVGHPMMPPIPTYVEIRGFTRGSQADLISFLKQKSSRKFICNKVEYDLQSSICRILCNNKKQAHALQQLDGIFYKQDKLSIQCLYENSMLSDIQGGTQADGSGSSHPITTEIDTQRQNLKTFLLANYQPVHKYLDISNLASKIKIPHVNFNNRSFLSMLLSILLTDFVQPGHSRVEIEALNLSNNSISSFASFPEGPFGTAMKNVKNLSLECNKLSRLSELDGLKNVFPVLEELLLVSNEGLIDSIAKKWKSYRGSNRRGLSMHSTGNELLPNSVSLLFAYFQHIFKLFPSLRQLDRVNLSHYPMLFFHETSPIPLNTTTRSSWFDLPETQGVVENFISRFFGYLDRSRENLREAYDDSSMITVQFIKIPAESSTGPICKLWMEYRRQNRHILPSLYTQILNSLATKKVGKIHIYHGLSDISLFIGSRMPSNHILENFTVDCWQSNETILDTLTPTLNIICTGSYQEQSTTSGVIHEKQFLRIFILIPSKAISAGQVSGWPVTVYIDSLYIFVNENDNQDEQSLPVGSRSDSHLLLSSLPDFKKKIALDFSKDTKLSLQYGIECLQQNEWHSGNAMKAFKILKARKSFPKDAFVIN